MDCEQTLTCYNSVKFESASIKMINKLNTHIQRMSKQIHTDTEHIHNYTCKHKQHRLFFIYNLLGFAKQLFFEQQQKM